MNIKNSLEFDLKYQKYLDLIVESLESYFPYNTGLQQTVFESIRYSLFAGGKRIRPVLALAVCDMLEQDSQEVLPFACAIEMIHTYSLIHDDLPSMDNDDLRRGKPTNHKVYGEGIATLAGDGLLNYAFELMSKTLLKSNNSPFLLKRARAMEYIAQSSGIFGMIGGQVIDLEYENRNAPEEIMRHMHSLKTGALLKSSILSSAIICEADENTYVNLENYAANIGMAFQIKDDILDVEGNTEKLGKTVGSDMNNKKSTYISLFGLDGANKALVDTVNRAVNSLKQIDADTEFLEQIAYKIASRDN